METKTFRTNLNCQSCVKTVTPFLNAEQRIKKWSVDTKDDRKPLSITGDQLSELDVKTLVRPSGFQVFEEIALNMEKPPSKLKTYYPLVLILIYLIGFVLVSAIASSNFAPTFLMNHFMGGFFVVFSFFKMLNLKGFAESYQSYDLLAKRSLSYSYIYPFIELGLGIAYLMALWPFATNLSAVIVMGLSSIGVIQAITQKKKIKCACLGTMFNLPMSTVTLVEDLLMVCMAASMLLML